MAARRQAVAHAHAPVAPHVRSPGGRAGHRAGAGRRGRRRLADAADHSGGGGATAWGPGHAPQLESPSAARGAIGGRQGGGSTGLPGRPPKTRGGRRGPAAHGSGGMPGEPRAPAGRHACDHMAGRGAMTKPPRRLPALRRRLYAKAPAAPSWRCWGLSGHLGTPAIRQAAAPLAQAKNGAPGGDGGTVAARAASGRAGVLEPRRHARATRTSRPRRWRHQTRPQAGGQGGRVRSLPTSRDRGAREPCSSSWPLAGTRTARRGRPASAPRAPPRMPAGAWRRRWGRTSPAAWPGLGTRPAILSGLLAGERRWPSGGRPLPCGRGARCGCTLRGPREWREAGGSRRSSVLGLARRWIGGWSGPQRAPAGVPTPPAQRPGWPRSA